MIKKILSMAGLALFANCNNLSKIEYSPKLTPEAFLGSQHFVKLSIAGQEFILSQPSSTIIVYFVSLYTIYVGYLFLKSRATDSSRLFWGIGLVFTGFGAVLAGTSYQAFGYEIKCSGREFCTWTSWWEIFYMLFSGPGMDAFLIASAYSSTEGRLKKILINYAYINALVYSILLIYGSLVPIQFLVSFEFLMLASTPSVILFIVLHGRKYKINKNIMDLHLRNAWLVLVLVIVAYVISLVLGITTILWQKGIWFTENDVLHVGMIYWIYYIQKNLVGEVKDLAEN